MQNDPSTFELIKYPRYAPEDDFWIPMGVHTADGFGCAVGAGSTLWIALDDDGKEEEYQLTGKMQIEWNYKNNAVRLVLQGTEVDGGKIHLVKIYFPMCVDWRRNKKILYTKNNVFPGVGFVITFDVPNSQRLKLIQFVFGGLYQHLELALMTICKDNYNRDLTARCISCCAWRLPAEYL